MSGIRYLNRLRLKQDSLVIERKETGKSLYNLAMVVLSLMFLHGLSLKYLLYINIVQPYSCAHYMHCTTRLLAGGNRYW